MANGSNLNFSVIFSAVTQAFNAGVKGAAKTYQEATNQIKGSSDQIDNAADGLCTMPGLSSSTAVSPGGIVCTSGVGGIYPRDLIIGTVTKVEDSGTDISATAVIKPGADIASITDVFIITEFEGQGSSVTK